MKLICGLGNPGNKYKYTRHNVGFLFLDYIAEKFNFSYVREKKFKAECHKGQGAVYIKPETYMNLSGESILSASSFFKIKPEDIIVIHDDVDLPFETIRIKEGGGTAGHNGLKSIVSKIGNNFIRIRVGVDKPTFPMDTADYVLQTFSKNEVLKLPSILDKSYEFLSEIIVNGVKVAMNKFN